MAKENALIRQKFGDRDLDSLTERGLRQMYREVPFDLNLVASNDEKIPVHYFAMILFSSYLRNKFKDELIFKPNIDVPLKEFSPEILKECVQFIYFGEAWIDSNMTVEFVEVVYFLELFCTCSGPLVPCIRFDEEQDDGLEGYVEFSRDPASILLHEDGKMFWDCEFSGCTSKTVTKVVDGVMMIKNIQPIHSSECVKDQAERKLSKSGNEANPDEGKILTLVKGSTKAHGLLVWQSDDSGDDSSIECDDDSDSHSSEEWSTTDDDETDDQIENNGEDFNEIITNECLALFSDESDSSVDILLP